MGTPTITVASCVPRQEVTTADKLTWLHDALKRTPCDLFLLPQEFIGGHHVQNLARDAGKPAPDLHVSRAWVAKTFGAIAKDHNVALGVGACIADEADPERGTEDYFYFERDGRMAGSHRKFALPSYDDVRTKGAGRLVPGQIWKDRVTPIDLPSLRLRVGTIFCWEVFSLTLVPAYTLAQVNLIAHPIKFAPRGWLTFDKEANKAAGEKRINGFAQDAKSQEWIDRLVMLGRHEALCPIAVSCNSWNIGPKFMALTGHVDEVRGTTNFVERPSVPETEYIHTFTMSPDYYLLGTDNSFGIQAFKEAMGIEAEAKLTSSDGYKELVPLRMHIKMRRLESYLLNGTTQMEFLLKAQARRTKPSIHKRAVKRSLVQP